ncbi:MAG TPA: helix-turn-helix domain-containing protein [Mycobacteriales bacterium]|nr:helix-turn-helix domain-containing protein [Mycobacteriales bacterium]
MTTERRPATEEEARALASTLRLRILRLCLDVALTNKEIAERLDRDPASVLHHVRTLVRTGFLSAEPERRGTRGAREVPYRATGKSWIMDVADDAGMGIQSRTMVQAFIEDVQRVGLHNVDSTRMGLRLTPAEHEELTRRLYELVEDFRTRQSDGEPWSLFTALHRDDRPV